MQKLVLVINVIDQCKKGIVFPESENEWPREELVKILQLAGIVGLVHGIDNTYVNLINMLLYKLNIQTPRIYALCLQSETQISVITDARDSRVLGQVGQRYQGTQPTNILGQEPKEPKLYIGMMTKLVPISAGLSCQDMFKLYHQPLNIMEQQPRKTDQCMEYVKQLETRLLFLEKTKAITFDEKRQIESDLLIKSLTRQIAELKAEIKSLAHKNKELVRDLQIKL